jgi:hypothetical protein
LRRGRASTTAWDCAGSTPYKACACDECMEENRRRRRRRHRGLQEDSDLSCSAFHGPAPAPRRRGGCSVRKSASCRFGCNHGISCKSRQRWRRLGEQDVDGEGDAVAAKPWSRDEEDADGEADAETVDPWIAWRSWIASSERSPNCSDGGEPSAKRLKEAPTELRRLHGSSQALMISLPLSDQHPPLDAASWEQVRKRKHASRYVDRWMRRRHGAFAAVARRCRVLRGRR